MALDIRPGQSLQAGVDVKNAGGMSGFFRLQGQIRHHGTSIVVGNFPTQDFTLNAGAVRNFNLLQLSPWGSGFVDGEEFDVRWVFTAMDTGEGIEFTSNRVVRHRVDVTIPQYSFTTCPLLQFGSTGTYVTALQTSLKFLAEDGGGTWPDMLTFDPGNIDGVFGTQTENAVRAFQSWAGVAIDGRVGQLTYLELDAVLGWWHGYFRCGGYL